MHYLTEALYKSLCYHRKLDDPTKAARLTLPYGRPKNGSEVDELVPFPPDDPERGELFPERVKALLRRHVVERCIYGVDINPLAVELARVSLWVETLDPELPFSFLDHKIKVGNSLVGCWLDRVEDYPLKAWEREGGDGKDGPRTQRIEEFLKGEKIGNRRSGDGRIKKEMREVIESRFSKQPSLFPEMKITADQVLADARREYETLHNLPVADPDERERFYRQHVQASPALRRLKQAMNEWCAVWFWPTDEESLRFVPTPLNFHQPCDQATAVIERLAADVKFLHWELEFPDVFTPERSGFDVMAGNPPWEVMKPISQEFFTEYDPLYRTYDKQTALRHQTQMFATVFDVKERWDEYNGTFKAWANWVRSAGEPFDLTLARGNKEKEVASAWRRVRSERLGFTAEPRPFAFQGSADLNSYKLFLEIAHHLLRPNGRLGFIVPSGLYTDAGCHDIRELFLNHSTWDWLFGFINWELIFNIYYRFKFVVAIIERHPAQEGHAIRSCFGRYKLRDWEEAESVVFPLPKANILEFSPKTLSILEITNQADLDICRTIYAHSVRIGDKAPHWEISYASEVHMANDSKHFKPREWWETQGYKPDAFNRWIGPEGEVALPLYEGRMIGQFDFAQKGYISGRGRTALWRKLPADAKRIEPQFLMAQPIYSEWQSGSLNPKIGYMQVGSSTNARSLISTYIQGVPCEINASVLRLDTPDVARLLVCSAFFSTFSTDFAVRLRLGNVTLNWFMVAECPIPSTSASDLTSTPTLLRLLMNSACLSLIHRSFACDWQRLVAIIPSFQERPWKHWWAVTEADRLRLRVENDALVADLYGIDPNSFDWILRDDPTNPRGFHRVDKQLPYRERLTGLAAAAFRALKEGRWSTESASGLSNDEFFDILGIPELTNAAAAETKGLSGPLILKREGCHVWKPENFPPDDPRHGWTWDDCWKDAVALLGSEEAVEKYIAEKPEEKSEPGEDGEPFQLKADKSKPKQAKMF